MERRTAIKNLGLSLATLVSFPAWAHSWSKGEISVSNFENEDILSSLISAVIPDEPNSPGALAVGVDKFIIRMIQDCYSQEVQDTIQELLEKTKLMAVELHQKEVKDLDQKQKESILNLFEDSILESDSNFFKMLKYLSIEGYQSSEYYLTTFSDYNMAPGYFTGCKTV